MVFLEYKYDDTPLHKMHPLPKVFLFLALLFFGSTYMDVRITIPILSILLILYRISKAFDEIREFLPIMVGGLITIGLTQFRYAIFMVSEAYFKVYDPELMTKVIIPLTSKDTPIFGETALTYGSLIIVFATMVRVLVVMLAVPLFLRTTSFSDLSQVLIKFKIPSSFVFILIASLRFFPELQRKINTTLSSQKLRGLPSKTRNPFRKVKIYAPILTPVTRYCWEAVDIITISIVNRAFGFSDRVTILRHLSLSTWDKAVVVISIISFLVGLYLLFVYNVGMI